MDSRPEKHESALVTEIPLDASPVNKPRFFQGWRKGVALGVSTVSLALLVNVLTLAAFVGRYGSKDGLVQLYEGPCETASRINTGVHLVINVLGTLMLSASNYCMQVLSAPTRNEVNRAHRQKRWVDIGFSSARNLGRIARWRLWVWILLVVSSLPLHLVYNSVVFTTTQAFQYTGVIASPGFIGGPKYMGDLHTSVNNEVLYNSPTLAEVQQVQADSPQFQRLENAECIAAYQKSLVMDRSDLVLVTVNHNSSDAENNVFLSFRDGDYYISFDGIAEWIYQTFNQTEFDRYLDYGLSPNPSTWSIEGYKIDHCLSRQVEGSCLVQSSIYLTAIVIVANGLKLVGLLCTIFAHKEEPLVTLGDAVDSFLTVPDQTTENACLLSKHDVKSGRLKREGMLPKVWKPKKVFRFNAVSKGRWWLTIFACLIGIMLVAIFLDLAIKGVAADPTLHPGTADTPSFANLWAQGFGVGQGNLAWAYPPQTIYGSILLANLPQLIFSILYFVYNGLFTAMSLGAEWTSFANKRKGLRVSHPRGAQRSTYYLQLPYIYAVPLIVVSAAMHWLISQSFFVLAINFTGSSSLDDLSYITCGYSPIAIIFALILGGLMMIVIVLNGFRRMKFTMPVAGGCSLAISAACHPPADGADSTQPLQWGVVGPARAAHITDSTGNHVEAAGHCAFSSAPVASPTPATAYA